MKYQEHRVEVSVPFGSLLKFDVCGFQSILGSSITEVSSLNLFGLFYLLVLGAGSILSPLI